MKVLYQSDSAGISRPTVVTLGVFDGLHIGHQLIMKTVVDRARAAGAVPTVITFEPHPRAVLHPESAPPLLQTFDQKIEALGVLGIEQTIVIHFDQAFSQIRAEDFLRKVVVDHRHMSVHEDGARVGCHFRAGQLESCAESREQTCEIIHVHVQ